VDRGFVLSDHADWAGLVDSIRATGAEQICLTHGYSKPLARWLCEQGFNATALETLYGDESVTESDEPLIPEDAP
jgi:putative mRNA 3-end processing factor